MRVTEKQAEAENKKSKVVALTRQPLDCDGICIFIIS